MRCGIFFVSIAVLLAVCVSGIAGAADRISIDRATGMVLDGGILYQEPRDYRTLFDDFFTFDTALWDSTSWNHGGTVAAADSLGGSYGYGGPLILSTAADGNSMTQVIESGQGFRLAASADPRSHGASVEFEAGVAVSDTLKTGFVAGLCAAQDSISGAGSVATNGVYFLKKSGSSRLWAVKSKGGTADTTDTGISLPGLTFGKFRITWNGSRIRFIVNDVLACSDTTFAKIPTAANVRPVFEVRADTTEVRKMYVDYVKVKQRR